MSMPVPAEPIPPPTLAAESVLVELDEVAALAAELSTLAAELVADASTCDAAAASFVAALGFDEGWQPSATATAWAGLYRLLAGQTAALAATMTSAVAATVAHDWDLAVGIGGHRPGTGTGLR
jgi:hypothetical protein